MEFIGILIFISTIFLAYANGANDNFKGVATLFGSKTTSYRMAILYACATTFLGALISISWGSALVKNFTGKGLIDPAIASSPEFIFAVAIGAAITVILASILGFPISTTHSLLGALIGAGLTAAGNKVKFSELTSTFVAPLLLSPLIALVVTALVYILFRYIRLKLRITKEWQIEVGSRLSHQPIPQPERALSFGYMKKQEQELVLTLEPKQHYEEAYVGDCLKIGVQRLLDVAHFISAGAVSFARGFQDTAKIVALLMVLGWFRTDITVAMLSVAVAMCLGGLLNARKVAETMSHKITRMNHGQGFTSNLITSILVIVFGQFGLPVSTTHVSVGAIYGIGTITKRVNHKVISSVVMSWVLTLPIAGILSAIAYWVLKLLSI